MKSTVIVLLCAFAALAGVFAVTWGPIEGEYSNLLVKADGATLAVIEAEDGIFPEGAEIREDFHVSPETCIGCQLCVGTCPVKAISINDCGKAVIDPELCINCGICASSCPVSAIHPLDLEDCALYGIDEEGNEVLLQEGFEED